MKILFGIIGLILGALVDEGTGAIFGLIIGILAGALIQYRNRLHKLEEQVSLIQAGLVDSITEPFQTGTTESLATTPPSETEKPGIQKPATVAEDEEGEEITIIPPYTSVSSVTETERIDALKQATSRAAPPQEETDSGNIKPPIVYLDRITEFFKRFFTTGNVVVKVGAIILIIGISFLLKLAADYKFFPVEFWFIVVAIGAIAMLIIGWRLRSGNMQFALVIQGTATGILYLTIFVATLEQFSIIPLGLAFALMLGLVIFSCILAILQDSMALAIFATSGGFLAPILTASGQGNHIALFSYYALLNAGILGIAWRRSWRLLNWTGFVFTFVIAALWGYKYYQPAFFNTTEPYLVLFFLFYIAIAILFAHRQPPQLKGLVDGSIVFGTPLVGFTLQSGLVRNFEYGQAWSALAIGAIYILLARVLWKKRVEGMRMLTESFLALGVIFASLAIPFALDGRWTAAAWALEGAGITWVGIRQQRLLPRLFGLILQIGAAFAFMSEFGHPHADYVVLNSGYIGSVLIGISALFIGLQFYRHRDHLFAGEKDAHIVLLTWGLIWWFAAGLIEIEYHVNSRFELNASLFFIALSFWFVFITARALRWPAAEQAPIMLLPVLILIAIIRYVDQPYINPFVYFGYAGWFMAFIIQYGLLYRAENTWNNKLLRCWHALTLWLLVFIVTWTIGNAISKYIEGMRGWYELWWGLLPAVAIYILLYSRDRITWPLQRFASTYQGIGIFPITVYLAAWVLYMCFQESNPRPLPYVPVINPQDIAQLLAMLATIDWLQQWKQQQIPSFSKLDPDRLLVVLAGVAFAWLNSLVAHAVHFYGEVRYQFDPMFHSELFQTSIAIVWTLTAFSLMGLATRRGWRKLWFTGTMLLAVVVLKLFIIDLDDSGTITRIVSFITVGILMLVIGYYSPLPPKQVTEEREV